MSDNSTREEQDTYSTKHREIYIETVLKSILPNAHFAQSYSFGNPQNLYKRISELNIQGTNDCFKGSRYDYVANGNSVQLIHYTSLQNLFNIINDSSIRMYDLNYSEDTEEYTFANRIIKDYTLKKDIYKSSIFYTSFCDYSKNTSFLQHKMMEKYGDNGNGVGIVFSIDKNNIYDWYNIHLSKVYYDEEAIEKQLAEFIERHNDFHHRYDFIVGSISKVILKMLAFHKTKTWEDENEVRLLYFDTYSGKDQRRLLYHTVNREKRPSCFYKFRLHTEDYIQEISEQFMSRPDLIPLIHQMQPKLRIEKVILEPNIGYVNFSNIYSVIRTVSAYRLGYVFDIEQDEKMR